MNEVIKFSDGEIEVLPKIENESIWVTQKQLYELFERDKSVISRHIRNIFKSGELDRGSTVANFATVQKEGNREVIREIEYYNLDMIISVGYRVNSKRATKFRQWATSILKNYILKGYVINKKRLDEFKNEIELLTRTVKSSNIGEIEAKGFWDIVTKYTKSWILLNKYDENSLELPKGKKAKFILDYDEAKEEIEKLKTNLITKKEATNLFGLERENSFKGIIRNIYQTFGGEDLLPNIEEKASNLFYYIVKDHPFTDGNKRIGAFMFVLFLSKNNYLYDDSSELKINSNTLIALALLIAESNPSEKELIIKLISNLISEQ
jgi:death-on-curing family protein